MWLSVFKIVLIVLLAVAVAILVVAFIRKSRAEGFPTPESSSHFWQIEGAMQPMPKPTWADEGEDRKRPQT